MSFLELKNISYSYYSKEGETIALKDINLYIKSGQFVSIVGPSGCGKSTLLSVICGLLTPTTGTITIDGKPVALARNNIGYMLQRDELFEWRTLYGNVKLGLDIAGKKDNPTLANHFFNQYGLSDFKYRHPHELSGGMRQRVALIRTLMLEPSLLLLDEPFSALDYQTRLTVCDDISSIIKKEHKTAILVTHDLAEAISVGETVYILSQRPGTIKSVLPLDFPPELSSLERRDTEAFKDYFNILWKELCDNE